MPFTHRVFLRDGKAAHVHGHVWDFEFEFSAEHLDANGFVIDFNGLYWLEDALALLKNKLVLSSFDPDVSFLKNIPHLFEVVTVPDASSEGLARHYHTLANELVAGERGVRCLRCSVFEDQTNAATFGF